MHELDDRPFIRNVEGLIQASETVSLVFFSSLLKYLPPGLLRRLLFHTSRKYPHIGFVIEPYCLFLFFPLTDPQAAQAKLPDRFELVPARIFADEDARHWFGMGIFNTRASTFWGSRLETYLIARDKESGITSWIFADILSNTIIAHPRSGITAPNCARALYTTNSQGEVFLDFRHDRTGRGLGLEGSLTAGRPRPLEQDLWIMGNASVGFVKDFGAPTHDPFAVIFDPAEVREALDIPVEDIRITFNTLVPDFADPHLAKAVCFPWAQHYMADSPGHRTFVRDPADMVEKYKEVATMEGMKTFSTKGLKRGILVTVLVSLAACAALVLALIKGS